MTQIASLLVVATVFTWLMISLQGFIWPKNLGGETWKKLN